MLCMVAYVLDENLQHVRTIRMWRGEFGAAPPFDIGPDTLFVAYSAWAEMTCFMVLGWKFPDAHLRSAHRLSGGQQRPAAVQSRRDATSEPQATAGCLPRLRDRRLGAHRQGDNREGHRRRPLARVWSRAVFEYCEEDVRMSALLLRAKMRQHCDQAAAPTTSRRRRARPALVELQRKAVAQIQARGMPIDMALWNLVQENKAAVIGELLRRFDPSYGSDDPIYTPDGEWSYARFERWLAQYWRDGVAAFGKRAARHRRRRLPR